MKLLKPSESTGDDLELLKNKSRFFASKSISESTRRAYMSDWNGFVEFCISHDLEYLPATPDTVCSYLSASQETLKTQSLQRKVCSIGKMHEWQGRTNPCKSEEVRLVLSGIKRVNGINVEKSLPITLKILEKMIRSLGGSAIDVRNRAIILIGWFGALRRAEIAGIDVEHLSIDDNGLVLRIRKSKTDQIGIGSDIGIPRIPDSDLCPVSAIENWFIRSDISSGPVFPKLGMAGKQWWLHSPITKRPWQFKRIEPRMITKIVKNTLRYIGYTDPSFSAHSLRRGLASEAGRLGVPERFIQRHLRHSSPEMTRQYIEAGTIWIESPIPAIANEISKLRS